MPKLTENEALLLVDALNGVGASDWTLVINVEAALAEDWPDGTPGQLARKWDVDAVALLGRMRGWSLPECAEVLGAVRRFWAPGYIPDTRKQLREVGLVASVQG